MEATQENQEPKNEIPIPAPEIDFEAEQNLMGVFNLLFEIDKRNHPEKYKLPKQPQTQNA